MSNPNPINQDIKKTIAKWILSLPYKRGDVVRTTYTEPPSGRKIEELEISSNCSSGVRVQLEGVRTATGTELWLDSGWIAAPIEKEPAQYLPFVGEVVNYTGSKGVRQLEVKEVLTDSTRPMIRLAGITNLVDPEWVSPVRQLLGNDLPYGSSLPYKAGDTVRFFQNKSPHYPKDLVVERIFPTGVGTMVKFVGVDGLVDPEFIHPIKEETKAEPKAMTDIKWIPVDPENLPEGEVLAINRKAELLVGKLEKERYSLTVFVSSSTTDENYFIIHNPVAYIPADSLKQLWAEQNPTAGYCKDSEAFKLLEWIIESDNSSACKALGEIPKEAGHTIDILAQHIVKISKIVHEAPCSPHANSDDFLEELIFWIKDYISD